MPMVAVEVTRRRSPPEPKTASSLPVTSCRALTSKPLPISSARLPPRMRNASCPTTNVATAPSPSTIASPGRTTVPVHAQSSRAGNQSLSPAARGESRRLASLGRGGARPRARRGQADPAFGRILRLPLVPRDGARVLRGPSGGRGHESPVRQRQGRPGGTPGSRPDLPARAPNARPAAGRLAAHHVPHARRRALLRRYVLPEGAALQPSGIPAAARARRADLPRAPRRDRSPERDDSRHLPKHATGRARASFGALRGADSRGPAQSEDEFRFALRRFRRSAEVSAPGGFRILPAPLLRGGRRRGRAGRHLYARAHGARGHLRPGRGRVLALQRGCAVADPALRKNALRQRAAAATVLRRVDRDEERALRARGR